ncbi:PREDICTED: uncharacterized protein LOC104826095 isoform X2 [Tarenaya hassleriana]|uniref:uncharacterized protein LOC104826095 isoform X2 n=1 Tax=Tarenaya hassleriana TaxID=28532 RepID=UPI00053C8967|nr:PREDICTED: uncharacterized protein LOC104826095 isoform X2 [Tarenaya hassleriana]
MLRNVPSLSVFVTADGDQGENPVIETDETLERTIRIGDRISGEFSFVRQVDFLSIKEEDDEGGEGEGDEKIEGYDRNRNMGFGEDGERGKGFDRDGELGSGEEEMKKRQEESEEEKKKKKIAIARKEEKRDPDEKLGFEEEIERPPSPPMHLAAGLGIDKFDLYGNEIKFDLPSFDDENCDGYYKTMLEDYPLHPLLLRNYAQFLEFQVMASFLTPQFKGDLHGAEDYYHRCTIVEPDDGEIMVNYARLVMRLHQDKAKASNYFERAVRASPADSNVLAAYASFLWETNDDSDEDEEEDEENRQGREQFELTGAEDRSSNPAKAETEDGETMYQYAKSFWEVHRDRAIFLQHMLGSCGKQMNVTTTTMKKKRDQAGIMLEGHLPREVSLTVENFLVLR